ncbi:uncharacterized protein LOC117335328 [Pecten maximus]|uniref:uncharacterized protein LOC117335328 n=1 Tax=Pecten maximus TaxID=6579 RepID=UPI00145880E6|nr:uncharacterized protein LOC117335328 [Pecten maximus]
MVTGDTTTLDLFETSTPPATDKLNGSSFTTETAADRTVNVSKQSPTMSSTDELATLTSEVTTHWPGGNTTNNVVNSTCTCRACSAKNTNYSREQLEGLVAELRQKLQVKRKATTKYVRTLTSAPDQRTSSKVVGYIAGIVLVTMAVGLLVIDSPNLLGMLKTIKCNLFSHKSSGCSCCRKRGRNF